PFLLAGAPSELADCPIRAPHRVTFARLPEESGAELVRQLGKVLGLCNESQLQEDLPNLKGFVANPDLTIFSREGPLIAALLEATYGPDFRDRLHKEYQLLGGKSAHAQAIYRYACYLHAVGL